MGAQPGDIYNGHVLGSDNVWHRLATDPAGSQDGSPQFSTSPAEEDERTRGGAVDSQAAVGPTAPAGMKASAETAYKVMSGPAGAASEAHAAAVFVTPAPAHPSESYWTRYRRSWRKTSWITGAITGLIVAVYAAARQPAADNNFVMGFALDFALATVVNALVWGSLVNLVVAAVKDRWRRRLERVHREGLSPRSSLWRPSSAQTAARWGT